jgi:hypothetical protein
LAALANGQLAGVSVTPAVALTQLEKLAAVGGQDPTFIRSLAPIEHRGKCQRVGQFGRCGNESAL